MTKRHLLEPTGDKSTTEVKLQKKVYIATKKPLGQCSLKPRGI